MTLPAPLTPPDSDLQDFPFMPLQVARLRDSDLAAEEHPEACWYAVLLWSAAWHQLPAGSLPDNDAVLTKLIGLGRDVKTFAKHRAGALRGFIKCSDGRLYHPIVAEQVLASWEGKLRQRWRTECGRIKKANQRNKADDPHGYVEMPSPSFEDFVASSYAPPMSPPKTANVPGDKADCPSGHGVQGIETGTGTGTGTPKIDIGTSSLLAQKPAELTPAHDAKPSTALVLTGEPAAKIRQAKARGAKFVPDDWHPNAAHFAKAAERGVNIDVEVEKFRLHEFRDPKSDFDRAFHRWLNNANPSLSGSANGFHRPANDFGRPAPHREQSRAERDQQAALDVLAERRGAGISG